MSRKDFAEALVPDFLDVEINNIEPDGERALEERR